MEGSTGAEMGGHTAFRPRLLDIEANAVLFAQNEQRWRAETQRSLSAQEKEPVYQLIDVTKALDALVRPGISSGFISYTIDNKDARLSAVNPRNQMTEYFVARSKVEAWLESQELPLGIETLEAKLQGNYISV